LNRGVWSPNDEEILSSRNFPLEIFIELKCREGKMVFLEVPWI